MLSLATSHISNSYNVYNCGYIFQVFLVLTLFKNMQKYILFKYILIHIIHPHYIILSNTIFQ